MRCAWLPLGCVLLGCAPAVRRAPAASGSSHKAARTKPAVHKDSRLFLGDRIVDLDTGAVVPTVRLSPVPGKDGKLEAALVLDPATSTLSLFDARSGQRRWSVPAKGNRLESVMVGQRLVAAMYFVHSSGAMLRAMDPATGRTLWESTPPPLTSHILTPAGYGMRLWLRKRPGAIIARYLESEGSYVQVFDPRNGAVRREFMPKPEPPRPDPWF